MKKLAIVGYGNLGKACERTAIERGGWDIVGIFSRRDGLCSPYGTRFYPQRDIYDADADVALLCTGSANDLSPLGISLAGRLNTVDSFDTHAEMRRYFSSMDAAAREGGTLSFVGIGWDPGLFSLARALFEGVAPVGTTSTFWGKGVSQGHSEAVRRIAGVTGAVQYTVPKQEAIRLAEEGKGGALTERDRHMRVCYVAVEEGADRGRIEREIREMPNYFAPYDVEVHFTDADTLARRHAGMPHGGRVLRFATANGAECTAEFKLKLKSNPDFTAGVLVSYASACVRLSERGEKGARTMLDIPVSALFDGDSLGFV